MGYEHIYTEEEEAIGKIQETIEDSSLSTFQGCLSMMSYNIGGGIVGLPFAFLHLGIPLSLAVIAIVCLLTHLGCSFYLQVRSIVPGNFETFYELSYMLYGKPSIYFIAFNITMIGWSMAMVYFIVFGDICVSLINSVFPSLTDSWWAWINTRATFVVLLAAALIKEILKKDLKELKIVSVILFVGVLSFVALIAEELITKKVVPNQDKDTSLYWTGSWDMKALTGFSILFTAFNMQGSIFPMFNSLKVKTNKNALKAVDQCLLGCSAVYILIGVLALYFFGSDLQTDVLKNIGRPSNDCWESYFLRIIFLIILGCHIANVYYITKESFLVMVDEYNR